MPKTNKAFWKNKFDRNIANDKKHKRNLQKAGWQVITVWECELKNPERVMTRITKLLKKSTVLEYPVPESELLKAAESKAGYKAGG